MNVSSGPLIQDPVSSPQTQSFGDPASINSPAANEAFAFFKQLALAAGLVVQKFALWIKEQETAHERAVVLQACIRRRQWKVGDLKRLHAIPRGRFSVRRLERLATSKKRGRPVVPLYGSLSSVLTDRMRVVKVLFDSETPRSERLKALKRTGIWPGFTEALYRGCYEENKAYGLHAPSVEAEIQAANELVVSSATLRKLCAQIRRDRRINNDLPGPSLPLNVAAKWLKNGGDLPNF